MPFLVGTDNRDTKEIGQGQVATGFNRDVYYFNGTLPVTNYDPADVASDWVRIKFVSEFTATEDVSEVVIYDGRETDHTIEGRKESTLSVKQDYTSFHESIEKLKNKQLLYMECIADDRNPTDNTGKKIYQESRIYDGKLAKYSFDKPTDGAYNVSGEGKFNTATVQKIFAKLTPCAVVVTASGGNTATTSTPKTLSVTATDIYSNVVDLLAENNEEIDSVQVISVSGPSFTQAGTNAAPTVTYSTTGSSVIKVRVTTKNNFVVYSEEITITVS